MSAVIYLCVSLLLLLRIMKSDVKADVRLPPSITTELSPELDPYKSDNCNLKLDCVATGYPPPQYEWLKDGVVLEFSAGVRKSSNGSITICTTGRKEEGYYQCVASNEHGIALSRTTLARLALEARFKDDNIVSQSIKEGQSHTIQCRLPPGHPDPVLTWTTTTSINDYVSYHPIILDERIQMDDQGNLTFAYVKPEDEQNGRLYRCWAVSTYHQSRLSGSYTNLTVLKVPANETQMMIPPSVLFASPARVIALEGSTVRLRCFFAGFYAGEYAPVISWSWDGGFVRTTAIQNHRTEYVIENVQKFHKGMYSCKAQVGNKTSFPQTIQVDVQAAPVFKNATNRPANVNVTEGESVTMKCDAYADPPADIVWMSNGTKLDPYNLPERYSLTDDKKQLIVRDLCKDCQYGARPSDLTVIQCNASNANGYAYGGGYINVLKKTVLTLLPENITGTRNQSRAATFNCESISDESTPITIAWYRIYSEHDFGGAGNTSIRNHTKTIIGAGGRNLTIRLVGDTDDWMTYRGVYRCVASNGYSSEEAEASLILEDFDSYSDAMTQVNLFDLWWIFLLAALLLLFIILLICCCIYLQRHKGDSYPVDEQEKLYGNNPVRDMETEFFQTYTTPDVGTIRRASLDTLNHRPIQFGLSEDGASLSEYGDLSADQFREDGSFIGTYNTVGRQANNNNI